MPKITTTISYEDDEYGRGEFSTFSREVNDLDVHDMLWYMVKVMETAGYDCQQLQLIDSNNQIIKTDW